MRCRGVMMVWPLPHSLHHLVDMPRSCRLRSRASFSWARSLFLVVWEVGLVRSDHDEFHGGKPFLGHPFSTQPFSLWDSLLSMISRFAFTCVLLRLSLHYGFSRWEAHFGRIVSSTPCKGGPWHFFALHDKSQWTHVILIHHAIASPDESFVYGKFVNSTPVETLDTSSLHSTWVSNSSQSDSLHCRLSRCEAYSRNTGQHYASGGASYLLILLHTFAIQCYARPIWWLVHPHNISSFYYCRGSWHYSSLDSHWLLFQ
jgi:hypothetical protein